MYSVYINHFKRNNAVVDTEELMFAVPSAGGFPVSKPIVKATEDSADNFSFTMESNSPYYDALLELKTLITVIYDGPDGTDTDVIFYGRVISVSGQTIFQTKNVTCAGAYNFLNDTYYEGVQEKHRSKITVSDYLDKVLANHNTQDPTKEITRGNVGVTLPAKTDKYEPTSWTQTSSLLSNMTSNYGGHMRVRYNHASGDLYLDWYKYFTRDLGEGLRPKVTVGKNILDLSTDLSADSVFTRLIPIGDTSSNGKTIYIDGYVYDGEHAYSGKSMPVSFILNLYTPEQLTDDFRKSTDYSEANTDGRYGIIYKTMTFSDADNQQKLWNYCKEWIKDCYFGPVPSFSIKAIDLHIQDSSIPKILLGECVDVTYPIKQNGSVTWDTRKLVCSDVSYDLLNPENNSYTFAIPSDILDHNKNNKKSSKKKDASSATGGKKSIPKGDEDVDLDFRKVWMIIGSVDPPNDYGGEDAALSFYYQNGELSGTVTCYDPDEVYDAAGHTIGNDPRHHKDLWFTANLIGKITLPNKSTKYVAIAPTRGVFAYVNSGDPVPVAYWYQKSENGKQYKYEGKAPQLSTFDKIAQMIEDDSDQTYGGSTNAASFRNYGKISGSVSCYDPNYVYDNEGHTIGNNPSGHKDHWFTAQIVGKFGTAGAIKYVATSSEFGTFAYTHSAYPDQVKHWYQKTAGNSYDNISGLITTEEIDANGERTVETFETDDSTPDGNKTASISNKVLNYPEYDGTKKYSRGALVTHNGSVYKCNVNMKSADGTWNSSHWTLTTAAIGQAFFGYDATASGDKWKVKLNLPVAYEDENGNLQIADGVVSADDFNIPTIPSFKTKLIVTDVLVANVVDAVTINGDMAYLHKIAGAVDKHTGEITPSTYVYTDYLLANNATCTHVDVTCGEGAYGIRLYKDGDLLNTNLIKAFVGGSMDQSTGVLTLNRADGSAALTFNMADMAWHKNAVSAAWDNSWNAIGLNYSSNQSISAGSSITIYPTGKPSASYTSPISKVSKGITITATGGSGGVSFVEAKCYLTSITAPSATDDQGVEHNCKHIKNLGTVSSTDKSVRVIFKVNGVQYNYYFSINR